MFSPFNILPVIKIKYMVQTQYVENKRTHIYQPAPWPVSPEPPAGRPGPPCFLPTRYLDSHSRHWPVAGLETQINSNSKQMRCASAIQKNLT